MSDQPHLPHFALLHGGGQGGWVWERTLAALELQTGGAHRAIALDAPGCGAKRGRDTDGMTMAEVAADLVADIEAAGLSDVILVGHSQAGQAIPFMARLKPGLFRRLVYVSCSIPLPGQNVLQMMGRSAQGSNPDEVGWPFDPDTREPLLRVPEPYTNDMEVEQAARFAAELGKDSWPPKTYTMTDWAYDGVGLVPAAYVLCLKDRMLTPAWQEIFAQRLGAERIVRIDAGHQVMNTRPQALAEALLLEARG